MNASAVGKKCSVAERAYLAGLIDGDGAICELLDWQIHCRGSMSDPKIGERTMSQ